MTHTKYHNYTDEELIREADLIDEIPRSNDKELIVEMASRLQNLNDILKEVTCEVSVH